MYLHIYQYPGLEWLPLGLRHKIVMAAIKKYNRWWAVRTIATTSGLLFLPLTCLVAIIFMGDMDMIDRDAAYGFIRRYLSEDLLWGYYMFGVFLVYYRCVNSSGLEQAVEKYLVDEKIKASLEHAASPLLQSTGNHTDLKSWVSTEKKPKAKMSWGMWLLLYLGGIGMTAFVFTTDYPPKKATSQFLFVGATRSNIGGHCKLEFSMQNLSSAVVENVWLTVTFHAISGDTISTEDIRFQFIDPGKSGPGDLWSLTQSQCESVAKVKLRAAPRCRIGGVTDNAGCGKYIQANFSNGNLFRAN